MKLSKKAILGFLLSTTPWLVNGGEIAMDDAGAGNTVHLLEKIPDIVGDPSGDDPPLLVQSNFPVSLLRMSDNGQYLHGGQPVFPEDVYVVVKSDCVAEDLNVDISLSTYDRSIIAPWDTNQYTSAISIDVVPVDENSTALVNTNWLDPSSFLASWSYTSSWCSANQSAGSTKSGVFAMVLAGGLGLGSLLFRDANNGSSRNSQARLLSVLGMAFLGALAMGVNLNSKSQATTDTYPRRRLLEQKLCSVSVEFMVDGCRRSSLENKIDVQIEAPNARMFGKSTE